MKGYECICGGKMEIIDIGLAYCPDCRGEYQIDMEDDPENESEFEKKLYYGEEKEEE